MNTIFIPETFTPVDHLSREVQIDREEFLRQLPSAIAERPYQVQGDLIRVPEHDGNVYIRLTDLGKKVLGDLELPMMRIEFSFVGMSDSEIDLFMDEYDQKTLRGSGGM